MSNWINGSKLQGFQRLLEDHSTCTSATVNIRVVKVPRIFPNRSPCPLITWEILTAAHRGYMRAI